MELHYGASVEQAEERLARMESFDNADMNALIAQKRVEIETISTTSVEIRSIRSELITRIDAAAKVESEIREKKTAADIDSLLVDCQVKPPIFIKTHFYKTGTQQRNISVGGNSSENASSCR